MRFRISIKSGWKTLQFIVEHIEVSKKKEHFKVIARNKTVTLESNRPMFRNAGLKHRRPDWSVVDGKLEYGGALETLAEAIMNIIEPKTPKK